MDQSITFVDVETPNHQNNCISSIGIIHVDNDGVVTTKYFLVDPETYFDNFNIKLTKITPEMVAGQPTFEQLWPEIEVYFSNSLVVGHNVIFDLTVINACLQRYHLKTFPIFYACTYQMSRSLKIPSNSYKLNDLSSYFKVQLDNHHHALADTKACMEIFYHLLAKLDKLERYIKCYEGPQTNYSKKHLEKLRDFLISTGFDLYLNKKETSFLKSWLSKLAPEYKKIKDMVQEILVNEYLDHHQYLYLLKELKYLKNIKYDNIRSLYELMALLEGISGKLNLSKQEINELTDWINKNMQHQDLYPYNLLLTKLSYVLTIKQMSSLIEDELLYYIKSFFNPELDQGDFVEVKDKVICLTGNFSFGQKSQLEKLIVLKEGIISNTVTKKVDYLVLGNKGSSGYKYGKYGAKTNKALIMKSKGHKIELISEAKLMEVLKLGGIINGSISCVLSSE